MGGNFVRGCLSSRPSLFSLSSLPGSPPCPVHGSKIARYTCSHPVSLCVGGEKVDGRMRVAAKRRSATGIGHGDCQFDSGERSRLSVSPFLQSRPLRRLFGGYAIANVRCVGPRRGASVVYCSSSADPETPSPAMPAVQNVKAFRPIVSFCQSCGGTMEQRIPEGEHEMRAVCSKCGSIHYQNPKMVVGCLVEHDNKVLLCKRKIQPSYGLWTLPAGYMELGESAAEGAARETMEEAEADVEVVGHFVHLDIPIIGQSYIIFRARLKKLAFSPGPESLECALFALDEIPFDSLAFSAISVALKMYIDDIKAGQIKQHHGVIDKRPGSSPSDPHGYVIRDHLTT